MRQAERYERDRAALDELIEAVTVDAHSDDEKLRAFQQALQENLVVPYDGLVIGEPVSVLEFHYDGNARRGLTARCRCEDGSEHVVSAADVVLPAGADGARHLAAYRKWLGLDPYPPEASATVRRMRKTTPADLSGSTELVALSVKEKAARCQVLGSDRVVTLRATRLWEVVPGEILVVRPHKQWSYAGHPYLSGAIESMRLDVAALGLVPLRLEHRGTWDPCEHYWGEPGEPIEAWARPIIARGARPVLEMEQILPGADPDDPFCDPIIEAVDLADSGDLDGAHKRLMALCQADLRCLDAHAHLGNLVLDHRPEAALRHYEVGLRIGELSLGADFDALLPWGHIDNRPFLRCMHGFGLCLWRLGRFEEAERIFDRMLWLNPYDNQGVRFLVHEVRARTPWQERREEP